MEIAKTIQSQLLGLGRDKVWSWGAHAWTAGKDFLMFKVNGLEFKGVVKITLNGKDLYDIQFLKGWNEAVDGIKTRKVVKEFNNVFFDEMVDLIDSIVEKKGSQTDYEKKFVDKKVPLIRF